MMVARNASEISESNSMEMLLYVSFAVERIERFELCGTRDIFSRYGIMIRYLWLRMYQYCTFDGVETILYDLRRSYCVPVTHKINRKVESARA